MKFLALVLLLFFSSSVFAQRQFKQLVWADEFDQDGNASVLTKWSKAVTGNNYNNELQYYTDRSENIWVAQGKLNIEAKKERFGNRRYTSAKIETKNKSSFTYGRFEARAKLPSGRGTWPAIWMYPENLGYGNGSWPDNGEIDILEHVGFNPGWIHGTLHTHNNSSMTGNPRGAKFFVSSAENDFHIYAVEWSPEEISFYVDKELYYTVKNDHSGWASWPFDQPFFLIVNLAIGGDWGGQQGVDDSFFPARFEIDYIRVYQ